MIVTALVHLQLLGCAVEGFCIKYQSSPTRGTTTTLQQQKNDNYYGSVDSSYIVREFR